MPRRDLLIFHNIKGINQGDALVDIGVYSGKAVEGIQKIAQTFTMLLFTDVGSCPSEPARGTRFYQMVRSGQIFDGGALTAQFKFAVLDIMNYLATFRQYLPESEQLASANLLSWSMDGGSVKLHIELTSAAGTRAVYMLPVSSGTGTGI